MKHQKNLKRNMKKKIKNKIFNLFDINLIFNF